ncbi:MAG: flagellar type III secretion system pore protein FliP [Candidatus Sumerlaeota bacterium]|nr:flagellar type III secretion system pore protein FliP [Candidatus Sumerlaeota bacterium]
MDNRPALRPLPAARRLALVAVFVCLASGAWAQIAPEPLLPPTATDPGAITLNISGLDNREHVATGLKILALMTVLSLAPAILIMLTSFTRIVIVLSFVKRALSTTEVPPQQVMIGLALFLTFFIMAPTWGRINRDAVQPYLNRQIDEMQAWKAAEAGIREFLFRHTRDSDLATMFGLSGLARPNTLDDVPTYVAAPAFMLSELKTAFTIGFVIFVPFLILDMVVASILLSMGMMMLPPVIVSLPFKIILFVLVDGWNLIVGELVKSFA